MINGRYKNQTDIQCEIFTLHGKNEARPHTTLQNKRTFKVKLATGEKYLIKFTSKNGRVKYFNLDVVEGLRIVLTVDFSRETSASFIYKGNNEYQISDYHHEEMRYLPVKH